MTLTIRTLQADEDAGIAWVAACMRQTLIEVLGEARGAQMYTEAWLLERVHAHLDPGQLVAQVFVAERDGVLLGYTMVRRDEDDGGEAIGVFSLAG